MLATPKKTIGRRLSLGCLLAALLIALFAPRAGAKETLMSYGTERPETTVLADNFDNGVSKEKHTCSIYLAGDTQPCLPQQTPTLHPCNGESRQQTSSPAGLQQRHIRLFHTFNKAIEAQQATRQSLLHSDGYFFYMLCRMLM